MTDAGTPIAYSALPKGTPVISTTGHRFGTVEHVLQIPEEDLFDGIVVATAHGLRFVDRDRIEQITTAAVRCTLSDAEAEALPAPDGGPVYGVDAFDDTGRSLHDVFGRLFGRSPWRQIDR